ncbi:FAR1-related protein [Striga asiatica]|uniref:FAR1-related protein n=1 Tax=Striga asiatica TaxID=4170 RepID=A0A5A7Q638_STRAF|nr:FAR1-related protein [Striga asiatica]
MILTRLDITEFPDKYILRRWTKDVNRLYMRVKINYVGWVNSPEQSRYDYLCRSFSMIVVIAAEDERHMSEINNWIASQYHYVSTTNKRPSCGSNLHPQPDVGPIADPKFKTSKGAPRKLHKKRSLQSRSSKQNFLTPIVEPGYEVEEKKWLLQSMEIEIVVESSSSFTTKERMLISMELYLRIKKQKEK